VFRKLILISLLFVSASAHADANDGEYLGFKLGEEFSVPRGAAGKHHYMGAMIYAADPGKGHQHIDSLSVYVSPKSLIIGSIFGAWYFSSERSAQAFSDRHLQTLEQQYDHWKRRRSSLTNGDYQLWVDLEEKPPIVDHWPSPKRFRVSVALIFAPDSMPREDWMDAIRREANNPELTAGQY
jgi:hypothetical protein